jgi:signal transduction histidine kinase/CheY-like chemotaxis protein
MTDYPTNDKQCIEQVLRQIQAHIADNHYSHAIATGLNILDQLGLAFDSGPRNMEFSRRFKKLGSYFAEHGVSTLAQHPPMQEERFKHQLLVIALLFHPTRVVQPELHQSLTLHGAETVIEHGMMPQATIVFVELATLVGAEGHDYTLAQKLFDLATHLAMFFNDDAQLTYCRVVYGARLLPWLAPMSGLTDQLLENATFNGTMLPGTAYNMALSCLGLVYVTSSLESLLQVLERVSLVCNSQPRARGLLKLIQCFATALKDSSSELLRLKPPRDDPTQQALYWVLLAQYHFIQRDMEKSRLAVNQALSLADYFQGTSVAIELEFIKAITALVVADKAAWEQVESAAQDCESTIDLFGVWCCSCSQNFSARLLMIDAELALVRQNDAEALQLYAECSERAMVDGAPALALLACLRGQSLARQRQQEMNADGFLFNGLSVAQQWGAEAYSHQLWLDAKGRTHLVLSKPWCDHRQEEKVTDEVNQLIMQRQQLEQASEAKSRFLAKMSHEIRTPMNAVIGLTRMAMKHADDSRIKGYLSKIAGSSEAMLHIVDDILDFSKIEAGKMTIEHSPFMLEDCIHQAVSMLNLKAQEKGIDLITRFAPGLSRQVIGDSLRLQQIMTNLVANAVKFTEQGYVLIDVLPVNQLHNSKTNLQVRITDTGCGMTEEQQRKLFMSFTQVDDSTTRKYGGTGLGLIICKQLCELMGGNIGLVSQYGEGTTFYFNVALEPVDHSEPVIPQRASSADSAVALIDGHRLSAQVIEQTLKSSGHHTTTYCQPDDFFSLMERESGVLPDILFLHLSHIGLSNLGWIKSLNSLSEKGTRVFFIGHEDEHSRFKPFDGPNKSWYFLSWPLHYGEMFDLIRAKNHGQLCSERNVEQGIPDFSQYHLLVVEDNETNREVILGLLSDFRVRVDVVENGLLALERVKIQRYDLILMDIQMPVMDGLTAVRKMRQDFMLDTPVVAMTAHAMKGDAEKSLNAGMNEHITKPLNPDIVTATLLKYLEPLSSRSPTENNTQPNEESSLIKRITMFENLDVEGAIKALGDKPSVYERLIRSFGENRTLEQDIHQALDAGDWEKLYRIAHTLKTSANYIGATQLSAQAKDLEGLARARQDLSSAAILGRHVGRQATTLVTQIAILIASESTQVESMTFDNSEVLQSLYQLELLAEENDTLAEDVAEKLYKQCLASQYKEQAETIYRLMADYEFEQGCSAVKAMLEQVAKSSL